MAGLTWPHLNWHLEHIFCLMDATPPCWPSFSKLAQIRETAAWWHWEGVEEAPGSPWASTVLLSGPPHSHGTLRSKGELLGRFSAA